LIFIALIIGLVGAALLYLGFVSVRNRAKILDGLADDPEWDGTLTPEKVLNIVTFSLLALGVIFLIGAAGLVVGA
jgi:hypothetical protein